MVEPVENNMVTPILEDMYRVIEGKGIMSYNALDEETGLRQIIKEAPVDIQFNNLFPLYTVFTI